METSKGPVVSARDLTRTLAGEVPVSLVRGIDIEVKPGEFVVITGPSGSGKSSLLYLLGLLDRPTSGEIVLQETPTSSATESELAALRLSSLGFVFQFHFLLPEFTAMENVALPMRRLGRRAASEIAERAEELLVALGLQDCLRKMPHQLSGGQSQRVAIARALGNDPALILADEPTGSLDTASSEAVKEILRDLTSSGARSVVAVTHDHGFAAGADRQVRLVDGELVR